MDDQPLFERAADAPPRIQRRRRILVHVLNVLPGDAGALWREATHQLAVETNLARRLALQPEDRAAERRLTAAGLPDDA